MAKAAKKATKKSETETEAKATETDGVLKINRDEAAKLLRTMGFKETQKYNNELLERRLNKMDQYKANYDGTLDGKTEEQVDKVIAAKGHIKVTGEEPKGSKKDAPEKKAGDGKPKTGKKNPPKERTPRGEGVIATIFKLISAKPMTKDQILEKLVAQFPDRTADSMKATISVQLPSRMAKERKVKIEKDDKGRYSVISK